MGDVTVVAFGILAVGGLVLLGIGAFLRARALLACGAAILLGLGGAWVFGPRGALIGALALALVLPRRPGNSAGT